MASALEGNSKSVEMYLLILFLCIQLYYLKKLVIFCDPPVDFVGPDFFLGVL